jgi:hypothetical protein
VFCSVKRQLSRGDEVSRLRWIDGWMRNDMQQESSSIPHVNYTSYQSEKKGQREAETESTRPGFAFTKLVDYLFVITSLHFLLRDQKWSLEYRM